MQNGINYMADDFYLKQIYVYSTVIAPNKDNVCAHSYFSRFSTRWSGKNKEK